ncbi:FmdB family zinc ribbon protein [Cellulomonas fimi]|uniref:FmdB family transcriptional regulator n=1 Tax=Cellulomonas fimi TaxID=1708 RepID=A0A7Y0QHU9_CELFI|nr:FmdB family zinc ribbon protein [Cellulomonas fimi]NMR20670.1 FmdB family transcriptional regulator [Cellulomonas fimi]
MPTYAYACTECAHTFEALQSFSDASLTQCPECAGRLRKVFSSVGVVFKGSGFYRNDSRSGKSGAGTRADASQGGESATGSGDSASGGSGSGGSGSGGSGGSASGESGSSGTGTAAAPATTAGSTSGPGAKPTKSRAPATTSAAAG